MKSFYPWNSRGYPWSGEDHNFAIAIVAATEKNKADSMPPVAAPCHIYIYIYICVCVCVCVCVCTYIYIYIYIHDVPRACEKCEHVRKESSQQRYSCERPS